MRMRIIFKSGTDVMLDVTEFTIGRSRLTGGLEELSWKYNTDTEVIMRYVDPSEVVCVLRIDVNDATLHPMCRPLPTNPDGTVSFLHTEECVTQRLEAQRVKNANGSEPSEDAVALETAVAEVDGD